MSNGSLHHSMEMADQSIGELKQLGLGAMLITDVIINRDKYVAKELAKRERRANMTSEERWRDDGRIMANGNSVFY